MHLWNISTVTFENFSNVTSIKKYCQTDTDWHSVFLFCLHTHNLSHLFDQTASQFRQTTNSLIFKDQMILFAWIEQLFK